MRSQPLTFSRQTEQLSYPLLSQDVLRTFGGAVQREIPYPVEGDAVGHGRVGQHPNLELASWSRWRQGPTVILPESLYCLRNRLVQAFRFYPHRVFDSFDIAVRDSAECHEASLSFRLVF